MIISPSIMGAKPWDVKTYVEQFEKTGIDMIHFDVMDGNYVPNISIGTGMYADIHKISDMPLDLHLMVVNPDVAIDYFDVQEGDWVSFHPEMCPAPYTLLQRIKKLGAQAGIAVSPGTSLSHIKELSTGLDFVIIMGVEPGFSGQRMLPGTINKVERVVALRKELGREFKIIVDGDCAPKNARKVVDAGVDGCVVGSALINDKYPAAEFDKMLADYKREFEE